LVTERLSKEPFKLPATELIAWAEIVSFENDQSWRGPAPFAGKPLAKKKVKTKVTRRESPLPVNPFIIFYSRNIGDSNGHVDRSTFGLGTTRSLLKTD
jgi:hypothetical protein